MTTTIEAPAPAKAKAKTLPEETVTRSNWCRTEVHNHCPGSGDIGHHRWWVCDCDCHQESPVCRDCRRHGVEVTLQGTCLDPADCQDAQAAKRATNPQWQMLQEIRRDAEVRRAEDAAAKALAKAQTRALDAERVERGEKPAPAPKARRVAAAPPSPQRCHEGCGQMTKGGKFIAGHDARLKGRLVKAARQTMPESGSPATRTEAVKAMAELIARDWPRKGVTPKITEEADAIVEKYGHDRCIEAAVAARYRDQEATS